MLVEALKISLTLIMENHVYVFNNELRIQTKGGTIGVDLTGVLADIFMSWWDREVLKRLHELDIKTFLYERYVDDITLCLESIEAGIKYDGRRLIRDSQLRHDDSEKPKDLVTFEVVKQIGDSIHSSIQLEIDVPSNHTDQKVPILDLKVWIDEISVGEGYRRVILHEHYMKDVSSKFVIHRNSALNLNVKRTILTQQCLRVMLNCSPLLTPEFAINNLNLFMLRLQVSGYDQLFRYQILKSAQMAYKKIVEADELNIKPLYRNKNWKKDERRIEKELKGTNWYTKGNYESVLFIPATPDSELKNLMQAEINKSKRKIRVVEKSGIKIIKTLQKNNPFKMETCGHSNCLVCSKGGKGNCRSTGVTYKITCKEGCPFVYTGQTGTNAFTRGIKHEEDYRLKRNCSTLWKHCERKHNSSRIDFKMDIVDVSRNDPTKRQILEAIRIRKVDPSIRLNDRNEWNIIGLPRTNITN